MSGRDEVCDHDWYRAIQRLGASLSTMLRRIIQHIVRAIPIVDDVALHGISPPSRLVIPPDPAPDIFSFSVARGARR